MEILSKTDLFLADVCLVGREYFPGVRINEVLQQLNIPVVNDEVFVPADWTGAPSGDLLLSDAGLSSFQWQSLAFKIPSVFGPDRLLPISCLKCHTF